MLLAAPLQGRGLQLEAEGSSTERSGALSPMEDSGQGAKEGSGHGEVRLASAGAVHPYCRSPSPLVPSAVQTQKAKGPALRSDVITGYYLCPAL